MGSEFLGFAQISDFPLFKCSPISAPSHSITPLDLIRGCPLLPPECHHPSKTGPALTPAAWQCVGCSGRKGVVLKGHPAALLPLIGVFCPFKKVMMVTSMQSGQRDGEWGHVLRWPSASSPCEWYWRHSWSPVSGPLYEGQGPASRALLHAQLPLRLPSLQNPVAAGLTRPPSPSSPCFLQPLPPGGAVCSSQLSVLSPLAPCWGQLDWPRKRKAGWVLMFFLLEPTRQKMWELGEGCLDCPSPITCP